ncbi:MAG: methylated-DNA-[protein]-cysteine S-methyltransferase [Oleispira sp.]|jgi:methylated-DNA-[protein]-cysteine S-methyltransferase
MKYLYSMPIDSPFGRIVVQGTKTHIQFLKFDDSVENFEGNQNPDWRERCQRQLQQYFSAELSVFDLPIDPQGTAFQKKVWQALCDVDFGTFASYQQLATATGNAKSVRAVASANARNPIWLIIPCHRIIGSDLALRGYAGGITRKAQLLMLEGLAIGCDNVNLVTEKTKLVLT